ncbi:hypothetical protein KAI58_04795 [Candidatus Gracilibacteria bacterium]|nr:hypothetical protein [Candidatus Gracilibacteria bacterium]
MEKIKTPKIEKTILIPSDSYCQFLKKLETLISPSPLYIYDFDDTLYSSKYGKSLLSNPKDFPGINFYTEIFKQFGIKEGLQLFLKHFQPHRLQHNLIDTFRNAINIIITAGPIHIHQQKILNTIGKDTKDIPAFYVSEGEQKSQFTIDLINSIPFELRKKISELIFFEDRPQYYNPQLIESCLNIRTHVEKIIIEINRDPTISTVY